jgi:hypothetical protein
VVDTDAVGRFAAVVAAFARDPDVEPPGGRGFGSRALRVDGSIFAMLDVFGRFVVKLPPERVAGLVGCGAGAPFDNGRGRVMRGWVVVGAEQDWTAFAREAEAFVRQ